MPVTICPTCASELEVAFADLGQPVQCVTCQETFVARLGYTFRRTRVSEDDPDAGYRGWRGKSDADYERRYGKPRIGLGTTALCFGITALVAFCFPPVSVPAAVLAIFLGALALRTEGKRRGTAGVLTGVLALLVTGGAAVLFLLALAAGSGD